jgi:hypothetical protein
VDVRAATFGALGVRQEGDADDDRATREWPPAVRGGAAARVFDRPVHSKVRCGEPDDAESEVDL